MHKGMEPRGFRDILYWGMSDELLGIGFGSKALRLRVKLREQGEM